MQGLSARFGQILGRSPADNLPDKHFISDTDTKIQLTLADNPREFIQSSS
jgi:hypothetical protein